MKILTAIYNNQLVLAINSSKNKKYLCPICKSVVILKRGTEKISHFAHSKNNDCPNLGEHETDEHLTGKINLFKFINNNSTKIECFITKINQKPDLINNKIAFEFQCSPITKKRLLERINGYKSLGIHSLWILGQNYRKKFSSKNTTKFFYYSFNIGFYILFLHNSGYVEIRYNCLEINGIINYQSKMIYSFKELLSFIKSRQALLQYNNNLRRINYLLRNFRKNMILGNKTILNLQNDFYLKGHNIDGAPLLCNEKYFSYPIFDNKFFLWKIICLNNIEDGINLEYLFKTLFKFTFPLIENINIFYKHEFKTFINILVNENIIKIESNIIHLLKDPIWFKDYLDRENIQNKKDL
ncbi:competence protein CoiA [Apilactobacillus micheneri]|uniref:Competence protein CoiA n=1 Tax=Apilactobacillus micheneri TaxID=1899430 RepID=A0A9Q8IMN9_9LACO|nr:hypothetical protein DY121_03350 [Apilactobacillus micheneri]TPR42300.1 hypothetical protein DY123_03590 [Apilactobacillus micheneri]TPR45254.1 hypothetical protein DY130_03345 [Apilactobacillus micheneri]TPR46596.1 hypothetical protein DY128_03345 [Apilactobacillus micheneri]TPR48712.1 hypothetical protein DY037_06450 [Apilactobacillus micheneri]